MIQTEATADPYKNACGVMSLRNLLRFGLVLVSSLYIFESTISFLGSRITKSDQRQTQLLANSFDSSKSFVSMIQDGPASIFRKETDFLSTGKIGSSLPT